MFFSFILIALVAFGGLAVTYFFREKETFLWRLAAGNIVGSAIFGLVGFVLANNFGLSATTAAIALAISVAPAFLLARKDVKNRFAAEWRAAQSRLDGANWAKFLGAAYYAGFFLLFAFFFVRAYFETPAGIFTGASQNMGDLPFHLGAIFSFTDGNNFPPQNPSFAGAKFSYPFIADFLTACLMKFGINLKDAMFVQNTAWALSLLVVLERFVWQTMKSRAAAKLAAVLLFFSGGLGFFWLAYHFWQSDASFAEFVWNLPGDYTIGENFRWGNSLVVLFITQRSLLVGMPLTIIVLQKLWDVFTAGDEVKKSEKINGDAASSSVSESQKQKALSFERLPIGALLVGLLAGTLPLIHLHSLVVLFVVTIFLFVCRPDKWRDFVAFGVGTALVAVPELVWSTAGSASRTSEFFGWNFGWNKREDENVLWFWLKNTGIFIPLLIAGLYAVFAARKEKTGANGDARAAIDREKIAPGDKKRFAPRAENHSTIADAKRLLLFYTPFAFLFFVSNVVKLAPWEWDNIKILIYWFAVSTPFVALVLIRFYRQNIAGRALAALYLLVLIASGAADVWRTASRQINYQIFDRDAVVIAEQIKQRTAPNALFLNAPTYNSAIVLSGRRSLMRYTGHLASHGIDFAERENDLRRIYAGDATADIFLRKHNIEYVLVSPRERDYMREHENGVSEQFFARFPVIAESGEYRVYQVK